MDISWHEYTDEDGANVPVTQASLTKGIHYWTSWDYVTFLWNWCLAGQKFYEYTC